MPSPRSGIDAKFNRARALAEEAQQLIVQYLAADPFGAVRVEGPDGSVQHVAHIRVPVPDELALVIGDAAHNARSALDHLAYGLVLANGAKPGRHTQFPIADKEVGYGDRLRKDLSGASKEHREQVRAICPWASGDHDLWLLHKLDVTDKHRLLVPTSPYYIGVNLEFIQTDETIGEVVGSSNSALNAAEPYPVTDGTVIGEGEFDVGAAMRLENFVTKTRMTPRLTLSMMVEDVDELFQSMRIAPRLSELIDHAAAVVEPLVCELPQ